MTRKPAPLVSVVMPVYNSEMYVAEAIESILGQTFADFEFIIVDDDSQDRSLEIIREYEKRDARLHCLRHDRNRGVSCARNRGIDDAGGDFVALMDSDDVSLPTRLEKQLHFLQQNPEIGAVGVRSKIVNHDMNTLLRVRGGPPMHAAIVVSLFLGAVSMVTGSLMIRRLPLRMVGGFEADFRYGEECDVYVRLLSQTQIRFANLSEILYVQRIHDSNKSSHSAPVTARQRYAYERRNLDGLWDEVSDDTLARFRRLGNRHMLNWSDRRAVKADLKRLIESLVDCQLVHPSERSLLKAEMDRRLEQASPRIWQIFCHWRRHHFGPTKWEKAVRLD
ncbi:MAG: glycosyltransferase [Chloroflexi bacterium]|nr:glycosyltransferase [Chloroflexota bacterium]